MSNARPDSLPGRKVASHLGVMLAVSVVLGVVVSGLAIPFAGVLGLSARNVSEAIDDLPKAFETEELPQRTTILDKAGNTIATVFDQNRINVDLVDISRPMVEAIVAIEDYRFYQHGALDVRGTLRALFTNQTANDVVQGGSSITQQLVKLTLQNQALLRGDEEAIAAATEDSYARKLRELRYAIALEKEHSKDWILERYLNTAYFGDRAYGIQAAAQHYFGVNAKDLKLHQAALLAGLVQSPEAFNPLENPGPARERRNVVLDRMAELGLITEDEAERNSNIRLRLNPQEMSNGCVSSVAPFYCQYVLEYLMNDETLGRNRAKRKRLLWGGGLTITTAIDTRMQEAADDSVSSHVYPRENAVGALALIEPGTGEVKALSQSRPMGDDVEAGETYLNFTVPKEYGDANGFQPGSTFKAFTLAAAIDKGVKLSDQIPSPSQIVVDEGDFRTCSGPYQSSNTWDPSNSTSASAAPNLYEGTQKSVNTFFVRLELRTGICKPWKLANAMGMNLGKEWQVPSFTLGVADASPLAMAEAYATFAARGLHCEARPVLRIQDADGHVLKDYKPHCTQVLRAPVADAVNDILQGVLGPGGFAAAQNLGRDNAGKTGTRSDNMAVWFVGYTPNLAGAAAVAGISDAGTQLTLDGQVLGGVYTSSTAGSTTAGPIWGDAFKQIVQFLAEEDFVAPDPDDIQGVLALVPSVSCQSLDSARSALIAANFSAIRGGTSYSSCPRGTVAYTSPAGGTMYGSGSAVTMVVSAGPKPKPKNKGGGRGNNGGGRGGGDGGGRGNGNGGGRG